MSDIYTSTWMNLSGGAPLRCNVSGSDSARLLIGEGRSTCEMEFDADTLRSLATVTSAAAAEMEELYQREEAEREAEGIAVAEQAVAGNAVAGNAAVERTVAGNAAAAGQTLPGRHHLLPLES